MVPELHGVRGVPQPFETAPRGFREKIRKSPVFEIFSREGSIDPAELSEFEAQKSQRWESVTKVEPQESKFTVVMSIHNEGALLQDSLHALMASDIPRDVQMNVVLATDGCTDDSVAIVEGF